jgi:hypothetical protein
MMDKGIMAKQQILILYNNFLIYPGNSLVTDRHANLKNGPGSYLEHVIPPDHTTNVITNFIIGELK